MRAGKPVVVHGDGTSLWTLTHSSDFAKALVGILGLPQAVGDSFTITSDEYLPWNRIYELFAEAAGAPQLVHIASDTIAAAAPEDGASLLGDKSHSVFFDTNFRAYSGRTPVDGRFEPITTGNHERAPDHVSAGQRPSHALVAGEGFEPSKLSRWIYSPKAALR